MTVENLMNRRPLTIGVGETFASAYRQLVEHRVRSLPILDPHGVYLGMFDVYDVWGVLLPKAARLSGHGLRDLAFVSSDEASLRRKLAEAGPKSVREFLSTPLPPVHPDTPLQEAIRLLFDHDGNIPVVERKTHRLVGLLSAWEILERLR